MVEGSVFITVVQCYYSGSLIKKEHYAKMPMQYTAIFHGCKNVNFQMKKYNIFLIFAQNTDCGYTLENEAVLISTHNLCFRAK